MLGEGLGGVKLVLVGVRELFPAQYYFLSPHPHPIVPGSGKDIFPP